MSARNVHLPPARVGSVAATTAPSMEGIGKMQTHGWELPDLWEVALASEMPDRDRPILRGEVPSVGYERRLARLNVVASFGRAHVLLRNTAEIDFGAAGSDWPEVRSVLLIDAGVVFAFGGLRYGALPPAPGRLVFRCQQLELKVPRQIWQTLVSDRGLNKR